MINKGDFTLLYFTLLRNTSNSLSQHADHQIMHVRLDMANWFSDEEACMGTLRYYFRFQMFGKIHCTKGISKSLCYTFDMLGAFSAHNLATEEVLLASELTMSPHKPTRSAKL